MLFCSNLLSCRVLAETASGLLVSVEIQEPSLHLHPLILARNLGRDGPQVVLEVRHPLRVRHRPPPRNSDVPPSQLLARLVVRNGDVSGPVGPIAPHLVGPPRPLEEAGEVDVGGGVEVARDVVAVVGHVEGLEQLFGRVPAAAAVLGVRVVVEGVVADLGHLAVADQLPPQERVHWV